MKEAVSERAVDICWAEVIFSVKIVKTVPTELELALCTLHEFTAAIPHNAYLASWTNLGTEDFVCIAEQGELPEVKSFEVRYREKRQLCTQLCLRVPFELTRRALESLPTSHFKILITELVLVKAKRVALWIWTGYELLSTLHDSSAETKTHFFEAHLVQDLHQF